MTCEKCGVDVQVGEWPFCPHGVSRASVIDDAIEGGPRFFETFGHTPVWIDSKSEWRKQVALHDVVHLDKHDRAYYQRKCREHDERLRDTGRAD